MTCSSVDVRASAYASCGGRFASRESKASRDRPPPPRDPGTPLDLPGRPSSRIALLARALAALQSLLLCRCPSGSAAEPAQGRLAEPLSGAAESAMPTCVLLAVLWTAAPHLRDCELREPWRGDPLPVLRRILAFTAFIVGRRGQHGRGACTFSAVNPVYLLGRLSLKRPPPTPIHIPLVLPLGEHSPYYCYRQLLLDSRTGEHLLVFPSTELQERTRSFEPISRLSRLLSEKPDPYWKPRSRLLARRVLAPLFRQWRHSRTRWRDSATMSVLDLGAWPASKSRCMVRSLAWNSLAGSRSEIPSPRVWSILSKFH